MSISRREAIEKIAAQRNAIREHIEKYYNYPDPIDKNFALKTISRCQDNIQDIKNRCDCDLDYSYEDDWRP